MSKASERASGRGSAAQVGIHLSSKNCSQKAFCGLINATASGFHQCCLLWHAGPATLLCLPLRLQGAEDGREVGTLIPLIHLLSPYSPLQLPPIAASAHSPLSHTPSVSFFPVFSSCPTAASGKSQPLSGETAAGENWSLSSIIGAASRAGSLPILALLWLLYCSCTDNRQTSCILPTKPGSVWVFS